MDASTDLLVNATTDLLATAAMDLIGATDAMFGVATEMMVLANGMANAQVEIEVHLMSW